MPFPFSDMKVNNGRLESMSNNAICVSCFATKCMWPETEIFMLTVFVSWQRFERPIRIDGTQLSWPWGSVNWLIPYGWPDSPCC